jgi:phospholipid/cholesterol/gamma-HCH transport system substrate-binding protein
MAEKNEKFKIKLGLFVVGSMLLFIAAIIIIGKQKNLFDPVFYISAKFNNVSGLQVGNNVRFAGINVGTIDKITIINDSTVQVDMLVKQSVKRFIKTDAEVSIGSEGIIGDKLLVISQGSSGAKEVKAGQELAASEPVEMDAIVESLQVTAVNAELISRDLASIVGNINSGKGTLGRLIQDTTIAENLSQTMENLESSSKGLDQNMDAAKESILFRGYFKRQAKKEAKRKEEAEKNKK